MNHVSIIGHLTTAPQKIEDDKRLLYIQTRQHSIESNTKLTTHKVIVHGRYVPIVDAFGTHLYDVAIEGHLEDGVVIVSDLIAL